MLGELLYADDLVLMSETFKGVKNTITKWMDAFESKDLKVYVGKTKALFCCGIAKDETCLRVKLTFVWLESKNHLSFVCTMWIHSRCAGVKTAIVQFSMKLDCRKLVRQWSIQKRWA